MGKNCVEVKNIYYKKVTYSISSRNINRKKNVIDNRIAMNPVIHESNNYDSRVFRNG